MPKKAKDCDCDCKTKTKKRTGKKKQKTKVSKQSQYVIYPNSIGYALNSQTFPIQQPNIIEYNNALAKANMLREQQMMTSSLIPRQQINTLTTTNPITKVSTNTQTAMLDPKEGLVEEVIEYETNIPPVNNEVMSSSLDLEGSRSKLGARIAEDIKPSLTVDLYDDAFIRKFIEEDRFKRSTLRGEPVLMTEPIKKQRKKKPNVELVIEEEPLGEVTVKTKRVRPLKVEPTEEYIPGVKKRIAMKNVSSIPIFAFTPEKPLAKKDIIIKDIPFEL